MAFILKKHIANKKEFVLLQNNVFHCNACDTNLNIRTNSAKSSINAHEFSRKHKSNLAIWKLKRLEQQTIEQTQASISNEHFFIIAELFIKANIPLYKLNATSFRETFYKLVKRPIPDESTLRKHYLPKFYKLSLEQIREEVNDNFIYLQVDESTDYQQRPLVSVLVGVLNGQICKSRLLNLVRLNASVNSASICQVVNDSLILLWPSGIKYDKFKLLVSDQAAYMIKSGKELKLFYPDLIHITCIVHSLHRVCELVRTTYNLANIFIAKFKQIMSKCNRRKNSFRQIVGKPIPKFPILTRWATYIDFCKFVHENFNSIKMFIDTIVDEDCVAIGEMVDIMNNADTQDQIMKTQDFHFICDAIKYLIESKLSITEQQETINKVLDELSGDFKYKMLNLLQKNPDYHNIFLIDDYELRFKLRYAPLTSVDVERSFSAINLVDTSRRQNLTDEHLKHYCVVYFNNLE